MLFRSSVHAIKSAQDGAIHHDDVTSGQLAAQMGSEGFSTEAGALWQTGHKGTSGTPGAPRGAQHDPEGAQ